MRIRSCAVAIRTGWWCGHCYANMRGRSNVAGHAGYRPPRVPYTPIESVTIMKKPTKHQEAAFNGTGEHPDNIWRNHAHIGEYLSATKYDDGSARETSALSITLEGPCVNLALNDRDLKQSAYTQAPTLMEALELMDCALRDGVLQWRPWKAGKKR